MFNNFNFKEMKIKKITKEQYSGIVYDLSIKKNHNYFANNILIHNCYMNSQPDVDHYKNILNKIKDFYGPMTKNQKPFQVALGGGEPTEHPDFIEVLKTFKEMEIEPNYTTNGMFSHWGIAARPIYEASKEYCGGVAVSCHPHLEKYWTTAAKEFYEFGVMLNFHIIISDQESIDYFKKIYDEWKDKIDYFVLLPYGNQGRAPKKNINWEYLLTKLPEDQSKIAFGANFYPFLMKGGHNIKVSLYRPEIMSKFLDLKDMKIYPSSFNLDEPIN